MSTETERLLQHDDSPTALVSAKLKTYLQWRALFQGYAPSTQQVEGHLASWIQSPVLDARQRGLGADTKRAMTDARNFLRALRLFIKDKNEGDLVQQIAWSLRGASAETDLDLDSDVFLSRLDAAQARADAQLAHVKAKAVADTLYSNPQFRALLHDGSILARDLLSDVIEATAQAIAPPEEDLIELEQEPTDVDGRAIKDDVEDTKREIRETVEAGKARAKEIYDQATQAALDNLAELQKQGQKFGKQAQAELKRLDQKAGDAVTAAKKQGKQVAQQLSEQASRTMDASIDKLAEITGISRADIEQALNEGVSGEEIIERGKKLAADAQKKLKEVDQQAGDALSKGVKQAKSAAKEADKQAGEKLDQAREATADAARKADKKGGELLDDASKKVKETQDAASQKAGELADEAKKQGKAADQKAGQVADDVKSTAKDAANKADKKAGQVAEDAKNATQTAADKADKKGGELLDDAKQSAKQTKDQAKSTARDAEQNGKQAVNGASTNGKTNGKSSGQTSGATPDPEFSSKKLENQNHLRHIGIRHESYRSAAPEQNGGEDGDLLNTVIKRIQEQLPEDSDISTDDLEQSARRLIDDAKEQGGKLDKQAGQALDSAKETVKDTANKADKKAGKAAQDAKEVAGDAAEDAKQSAKQLDKKAGKAVDDAKDKAGQVAEDAKKQGKQVAADVSDKAQQAGEAAQKKGMELDKKAGEVVDEASKRGKEVYDEAAKKGRELDQTAGQVVDEASKRGKEAYDQAAEVGSQVAADAKQKGQEAYAQAEDIAADIKARVDNISQEDIERAVQDLVSQAKQKFTEVTGLTEDDVKQGIETAKEKGRVALERTGDAAVEVSAQTKRFLQTAPRDAPGQIHDTLDATQELTDKAIAAVKESTEDIRAYLEEKFPPKRRKALKHHFRLLAASLRDNTDYSNSLDGLISVGRKYVNYVMTFTDEITPDSTDSVVRGNEDLDRSVRLTLELLERFTNGRGFGGVQRAYARLRQDLARTKDFESLGDDILTIVKRVVQDFKYAASDDLEAHVDQLVKRVDSAASDTGIKRDFDRLIREIVGVLEGFSSDKATQNLYKTGQALLRSLLLDRRGSIVFKQRIVRDLFHIVMPSAIRLVQYIPISRVEFQNADIDLLLENLVFESSASHDQSFLPYKLRIENQNVVQWLNAYKLERDYSQAVTAKIRGLTLAVRDAGFFIRKKTGFWRFSDTGLVDILMDGPGIDIDVDLAMSTEDEEADVTKDALFVVRDVRVKIRKFDFTTSGAGHGWLLGLFKPFMRGFVKQQIELAIATGLREQLEYYEYQLRTLRHRFRTAYIANNGQASVASFLRAVATANAGDNRGRQEQYEIVIGGSGPLRGIYTKASIQKTLEEEDELIELHGRPNSWRNDVFDVHA